VRGKNIVISGEEAHHILDVMRLKALDKVVAFDGTGREYVGFIRDARRRSLTVEIVETKSPLNRKSSGITLIQAIPKKERMDYIVEKATELGAFSILPVVTKRTVVKWDAAKKAGAVSRWQRIAVASAKQCGRVDIPKIGPVTNFPEALKGSDAYDLALMAALTGGTVALKEALMGFNGGKLAIAIGPEGDFTPEEVKMAVEANFRPVSLGRRVLRSDTAGLAALAILNHEFAD
jgi:16S rRNA (uracil1498-N3)-methyltransferase